MVAVMQLAGTIFGALSKKGFGRYDNGLLAIAFWCEEITAGSSYESTTFEVNLPMLCLLIIQILAGLIIAIALVKVAQLVTIVNTITKATPNLIIELEIQVFYYD